MAVDLHLHSLYSDGTATPAELAELAARRGLAAISLTDHDTVDGIPEILEHGRRLHLAVIPGMEVGATHRDLSLHILGYHINHTSSALLQWLQPLQQGRQERNEKILAKMRQMGMDVRADELRAISTCGQTGRPHIARLLLNKGIVGSLSQAFHQYLRRGAPAWFSRFSYTAAESIEMIHQAGGLAILAHPGQLDPELRTLPLLLGEMVERGLDGLEVYYPAHSEIMRRRLTQLARKYNLVVTGGSDYHGQNRSTSAMAGNGGFAPPDTILASLAERLLRRANGGRGTDSEQAAGG